MLVVKLATRLSRHIKQLPCVVLEYTQVLVYDVLVQELVVELSRCIGQTIG